MFSYLLYIHGIPTHTNGHNNIIIGVAFYQAITALVVFKLCGGAPMAIMATTVCYMQCMVYYYYCGMLVRHCRVQCKRLTVSSAVVTHLK